MKNIRKLYSVYYIVTLFLLLIPLSDIYAASSSLTVKTKPEGVEVWINNNYIGDSPVFNKEIKPGKYKIKLIDPIHKISVSDNIYVKDGASVFYEKTIQKKFGVLKVSSEPKGAEVFLSTPLGRTPLERDFMNPGKYRLTIKHPKESYVTEYEEIIIEKDKSVEVSKKLEKIRLFDKKAFLRIGLGAGAAFSLIWALSEHGKVCKSYNTYTDTDNPDKYAAAYDKWESSKIRRNMGIILGCVCIAGFEVVAFF